MLVALSGTEVNPNTLVGAADRAVELRACVTYLYGTDTLSFFGTRNGLTKA